MVKRVGEGDRGSTFLILSLKLVKSQSLIFSGGGGVWFLTLYPKLVKPQSPIFFEGGCGVGRWYADLISNFNAIQAYLFQTPTGPSYTTCKQGLEVIDS